MLDELKSIRITAIKFALDTLAVLGRRYDYKEVLEIAMKYEQFILNGK